MRRLLLLIVTALALNTALACGLPREPPAAPPAANQPCVPGQYCPGILACTGDEQCVLTVGLCDEQDCVNSRYLLDYRSWLNDARQTTDCRKRSGVKGIAAPCWCNNGKCAHRN